jgi:hypothetical protein
MKNISLASLSILTFVIALFTSCSDFGTMCTTEFITYDLYVKGDTLTEYFTIRMSNNDTIDHKELEYFPEIEEGGRSYIVLTDGFKRELDGKREIFSFIGIIDKKVVIREMYVFGGGECHVYKVSGKDRIDL